MSDAQIPSPSAKDDLQQTRAPKVKVVAATGGAAVGSAFSVLILWGLTSLAHLLGINNVPSDVSAAITTLVTTIATGLAGYYTPPGGNEGVVVEDGKVKSASR